VAPRSDSICRGFRNQLSPSAAAVTAHHLDGRRERIKSHPHPTEQSAR
jgi:hypothetical protein